MSPSPAWVWQLVPGSRQGGCETPGVEMLGDANTAQRQFKHHRRQQEAEASCPSVSGAAALLELNNRLEQKTGGWQRKKSKAPLEGGLVCPWVSGGM